MINENHETLINSGLDIIQGLVDGIFENMDLIEEAVIKTAAAIGDFVAKNSGKFIKIGMQIFGMIITGLIQAALSLGFGIGNMITRALGIEATTQAPDLFALRQKNLENRVSPSGISTSEPTSETDMSAITLNQTTNITGNNAEIERAIREERIETMRLFERLTQSR